MESKKPKKQKETYKKVKTLIGVEKLKKSILVECNPSGDLAVIKEIDISQMD